MLWVTLNPHIVTHCEPHYDKLSRFLGINWKTGEAGASGATGTKGKLTVLHTIT